MSQFPSLHIRRSVRRVKTNEWSPPLTIDINRVRVSWLIKKRPCSRKTPSATTGNSLSRSSARCKIINEFYWAVKNGSSTEWSIVSETRVSISLIIQTRFVWRNYNIFGMFLTISRCPRAIKKPRARIVKRCLRRRFICVGAANCQSLLKIQLKNERERKWRI